MFVTRVTEVTGDSSATATITTINIGFTIEQGQGADSRR